MHLNMDFQAQAIMHLAASPFHFPSDDPFGGAGMICSSQCHLHTSSVKHGHIPPRASVSQTMQTGSACYSLNYGLAYNN